MNQPIGSTTLEAIYTKHLPECPGCGWKREPHQHHYTVVVEKRDVYRHDGSEIDDLYLTDILGRGDVDGWKATKVMCECGEIKEL